MLVIENILTEDEIYIIQMHKIVCYVLGDIYISLKSADSAFLSKYQISTTLSQLMSLLFYKLTNSLLIPPSMCKN